MSSTYYARNREAILARRKERRAANPERYREAGRKQMARWRARNPRTSPHHGLSPAQIQARLVGQGGVCAVCRGADTASWHGDHDHASGTFRGVLCARCNMGLGLFHDDPVRLQAAVAYLARHTALQALL